MNKYFSHLVWLGAGTASEPTSLLEIAERVTLVDARESACLLLRKQHSQEKVDVQQRLLAVDSARLEFTEYNLIECSAVSPVTGLKTIYPGLKTTNKERITSTPVTDFIASLMLSGNNNLLIMDILDSNLALLESLGQGGQLHLFSDIYVQAGVEPLYESAPTNNELMLFLQQNGYLLQQTSGDDPDLPWLNFSLNPLWQTLEQSQQTNEILTRELNSLSELLLSKEAELSNLLQERDDALAQLLVFQSKKSQAVDNAEPLIDNTAQQEAKAGRNAELIDKLHAELAIAKKHATERLKKIDQLEKSNRKLDEANTVLINHQKALKQEMLKAEAQINIIKDLFLTP
ncbi:hypothetical protein ACSV5M_12785 [Cellvibrio sp. ARAG 10.3]|uniref:hypothetical protein n=1 Tax=Cellvibrio sp. ARAG 10.3 TaxID=3451358 RepID=UPI003F46A2B7